MINLNIYHISSPSEQKVDMGFYYTYICSLPRQAVQSNLRSPVKSVSAQNSSKFGNTKCKLCNQ